jgi:hypothetical protein
MIEELDKIERRAKEIKKFVCMKSNKCDGGLDLAMNVDEEVIQDQDNVNKIMNIILDGRAACIPRDDVIHVRHSRFSIKQRII